MSSCTKKNGNPYPPIAPPLAVEHSATEKPLLNEAESAGIKHSSTRDALSVFYSQWQGTPYKLGGMSRKAIDCSALTCHAYKDIFGISLPRTVIAQARKGKKVDRASLQPGDLVFFKTGSRQRHVGIYLEDSTFIHASSSKGVMLSRLDEPYWSKVYWKARRVMPPQPDNDIALLK